MDELYYKKLLNDLVKMSDDEWNQMDLMFDNITENCHCVPLPNELFDESITFINDNQIIHSNEIKNDIDEIFLVELFTEKNILLKENYGTNTISFIEEPHVINEYSNNYSIAANDEQYAIAA
ncbi:hypothetical protein EV694_1310 [Volucribacter psittacicida]|uniref:Uncharacterized protein n=1 Tax=Volucribacter psittacicida TaxID=203482 RepID=A0A4R1G1H5_9PAST|nr:hypothetical protein [Volucribacter psittacicida]TCJ98878.1 hypothetical protein EV694_1310 [Volucribacter psittacicida]